MISAINKLLVLFLFSPVTFSGLFSQEIIPAMPYGGKQQLKEFIDQEIVYPEAELQKGTEGTVIITCLVNRDAKVSNIKVTQSVSPALDAEALRIFNLLLWKPATYLGSPRDGKAEVSVEFSVKHYRKIVKNRGYENAAPLLTETDTSGRIFSFRNTETPPKPVFKEAGMSMQQFMADNFLYPEPALRQNITGIVELRFVVEPNGRISNVEIQKHLGAGCSEEAMRLVKLFTWTPGMAGGKAVRTMMSLSMSFSLSGGNGYSVSPAQPGISLQ
ncbi:MAG TPA: energy transducer TonB [Bacteroidales bacterium]|nr:energy transducer TonB [Bacteroidales bacterium]